MSAGVSVGVADIFIVNPREYLLIALMAKFGLERERLSKFHLKTAPPDVTAATNTSQRLPQDMIVDGIHQILI